MMTIFDYARRWCAAWVRMLQYVNRRRCDFNAVPTVELDHMTLSSPEAGRLAHSLLPARPRLKPTFDTESLAYLTDQAAVCVSRLVLTAKEV